MNWPAVASILSRLGVRITYLGNDRLDIRGVSRDELAAIAPHKWHLMACLILRDVTDPEAGSTYGTSMKNARQYMNSRAA
jgi:hypothetical protein